MIIIFTFIWLLSSFSTDTHFPIFESHCSNGSEEITSSICQVQKNIKLYRRPENTRGCNLNIDLCIWIEWTELCQVVLENPSLALRNIWQVLSNQTVFTIRNGISKQKTCCYVYIVTNNRIQMAWYKQIVRYFYTCVDSIHAAKCNEHQNMWYQ